MVKLKQAGLSDDIVLSQIKNSGAIYNLTTDQIISLTQAGVSGPVIKALISGNGSTAASTAPVITAATPQLPRPARAA